MRYPDSSHARGHAARVGLTIAVLALLIATFTSTFVLAQDEAEEGMPPMGPPAQMKDIAFMQGKWTVDMQLKMDPSQDWQSYTGQATVKPELDGCLQTMDFTSEMQGTPFKGRGFDTFNRETGQYESFWIDSMSAHMSKMAGNWEKGQLVMTGEDTMMGKPEMLRTISEKKSDDEVYFEMSVSMDEGKTWITNMKMTYHRVK
jgi:hypothetical protein